MRTELDNLLCTTFPNLYRARGASMRETCMCWGFPGDGWFGLLWELSVVLEAEILKMPEDEHPCAVQVKEKFGTLRFYMTGETDVMSNAIRRAERRSCNECEDCGAPAQGRGGGWVQTLCSKCAKSDDPLYIGSADTVTVDEIDDDGDPVLVFGFKWSEPLELHLTNEEAHRTLMERLVELWAKRSRRKVPND